MSTIVKSKSNICNNRTADGTPTEVVVEVSDNDGRITADIIITFDIRGETERHAFRVEAPLGETRPALPPKP